MLRTQEPLVTLIAGLCHVLFVVNGSFRTVNAWCDSHTKSMALNNILILQVRRVFDISLSLLQSRSSPLHLLSDFLLLRWRC